MAYGTTLSTRGAGGTSGHFGHHDPLRTRFNAYTTVSASVTDPDFAGGADPSGVADSGAAIAAAWAAASPYAMVVYPPSSSGQAVYKTTAALIHPAKPLYHWCPRGAAVIKNTGTGHVWDSNGADNWTVDGLTLDGNYPTRTSGRAFQLIGSTGFLLRNFRVQNSGSFGAAIIGGCQSFWLEDFTIDGTRDSGLWFGAESTGVVERGWIRDGYLTNTNLNNGVGHAGVQAQGYSGAAATVPYRRLHFRDVVIDGYTRVGWGIDYMTDSVWQNCEARGEHTGEAFALTGARNRISGGRYGESTGAAGLLLWTYAGNDQDNADTEISGLYLPGPAAAGNQGIAFVAGEAGCTLRRARIHDNEARGWGSGMQHYAGPGGVTLADDGTVYIRDNLLAGNSSAYTFAAPFTPVLRGNLTAADTIDA